MLCLCKYKLRLQQHNKPANVTAESLCKEMLQKISEISLDCFFKSSVCSLVIAM
jgi:hypothetical protein